MYLDKILRNYSNDIFRVAGINDKARELLEKRANLPVEKFAAKEELRNIFHKRQKYPEIIGTHPDFEYLEHDFEKSEYHYAASVFVDIKGSTSLGTKLPLEDVQLIKNRIITNAIEFFQVFDGHVHRIQGDAVFAIFGRKDMKKANAIIDALNASSFLQYYFKMYVSPEFSAMGFPPIKIRIGIDFGDDEEVLWSRYGIQNCSEVTTTSIHTDLASKLQSYAAANSIMIGNNVIKYLDLPLEFYSVKQHQENQEKVEDQYIINNEFIKYEMWQFDWEKYIKRFEFLDINSQNTSPLMQLSCTYSYGTEPEAEYLCNCSALPKNASLKFQLNMLKVVKWEELIWEVNNRGQEATEANVIKFDMPEYKNKMECIQSTAYKGHHYMKLTVKNENRIIGQKLFGIYVCD